MKTGSRKARLNESLVHVVNRPPPLLFLEGVRRLGDVVHVPIWATSFTIRWSPGRF